MKKLLLILALACFPAFAHAAGGTCPSGVPSGVTSCFYVDAVNGLDTNNGTTTSTPWQHAPGMAICTSTCGSTTLTPGEGVILKGNVTWSNSSLGVLLATNGSSGSPVYYGNPSGSTYFAAITGTANTDATGKVITWESGVHSLGDFSSSWIGSNITINGTTCTVLTVTAATWNNPNGAGTMATKPQLTCSQNVGANLTGTAFSASIWGRPILNAGGTAVGSNAGLANVIWRTYANWIITDGIEITGFFWTGAPAAGTSVIVEFAGGTPGQGTNDEYKNILIHGWTHDVRTSPTCTTETQGFQGDSGIPNNNVGSSLHDSIITGIDVNNTSGTSLAATFGSPPIMYRTWIDNASDGAVTDGINTIHDSVITQIGPTFQISNTCGGVAHTNAIELNGQSTTPLIYNNVISHLATGTLALWIGTNSGVTGYAFDNVIYDTDTGNILDWAQSVANNGCPAGSTYCNAAGSVTALNNTVECGPNGSPSAQCQGSNSALTAGLYQNNFFITSSSIFGAPPTQTLTTNLGSGNNGVPYSTACTTDGYCPTQNPVFSPTSGSGITVGTGTSVASICSTINGIDTTAGSECLNDTNYGVAIDTTSWTVTGPGRTSHAWNSTPDIGAIQFASGGGTVATPTFSPVAGTYTGIQTVTISTSTGGATLCYTTDGSTPTEVANACSGGTTQTYSTQVSVASSLTLKALGTLSGSTDSAVGSAAYVIMAAGSTSASGVTFKGMTVQ